MFYIELDNLRVQKEVTVTQKDDIVEVEFYVGKNDIPNLHPKTLSLCKDVKGTKCTFYSRKVVDSHIKGLSSNIEEVDSVTLLIKLGDHVII